MKLRFTVVGKPQGGGDGYLVVIMHTCGDFIVLPAGFQHHDLLSHSVA